MKKRIFAMLLCVSMLMGLMSVHTLAADAVKAGEKAITTRQTSIYEDISAPKSSGVIAKNTVVDVLEAYVTTTANNNKYHKIKYTEGGTEKTVYIQALLLGSIATLSPYDEKAAQEEASKKIEECYYVNIKLTTPSAGAYPVYIAEQNNSYGAGIKEYKWSGNFDKDGNFKAGEAYTVEVHATASTADKYKVFSVDPASHKINGNTPTVKSYSEDKRSIVLAYTFEIKGNAAPKLPAHPENTACTPVSVSKFEDGDYGTMRLISGNYSIYHEPDSRTMYANSQNKDATIYVLEAGIDGVDTEAVYYAVWNERLQEVDYVNMNDARATFGDFVKEGNDPARPYHEKFAEKRAEGRQHINEITCVEVDMLYASLAEKPYLKGGDTSTGFLGDDTFKGLYTCTGTVYSTTEIPKPYSMVTATSTLVAKEGYHFAKNIKLPDPVYGDNVVFGNRASHINNSYSFNYIDEKTIELVYHEYVDHTPLSNTPTEAMKDYNERHKYERGNAMPVIGTSKLSDHALHIGARLWHYPIGYTSAFEIQPGQIIEIIDFDLTDEIPDINGDWYRVKIGSGMGFVPASYLEDVVRTDYWEGAPAINRDSRYEFAGGSGTKEDPYLIETPEQLDAIRKNSAKYFKLIKDIDLSNWGNWIPIGGTPAYGGNGDDVANKAQFGADSFRGQLDGNGHVISGMTIKINEEKPYMQGKGNMRYFGLVGYMSDGLGNGDAGIRNLGLINFNIDVTYSAYSESLYIWAGAFATHALNATITNCYTANGKINFTINKAPETDMRTINTQFVFGGLAAEIAGSTVTKCFSDTDITVKSNDKNVFYLIAGGLASSIQKSKISECYNAGDITLPMMDWANGNNSVACGLFVYAEKYGGIDAVEHSTVTDCYNKGNLTANNVAGLAYYGRTNCYCHFSNCYNIGKFTIDEGIAVMGLPGKADFVYLPDVTFTTSNCYTNGNSVSGSAWKSSASLGRKVLAAIPEDSFVIPTVSTTPSAPKAEIVGTFEDVPADAWFAEPVKWAVDKKITNGTSPTTFSPDTTCTKAQILTFIWRAMGEPQYTGKTGVFTNVTYKDYYFGSARWAYEKGMVEGGEFDAGAPVTRADTVVFLWKNAGSPEPSALSSFTDVDANAAYAKAVAWAVENGITSGTSATTFSPDMTCTRGHIVTFLQRAVK